jgi:hypothetical protein
MGQRDQSPDQVGAAARHPHVGQDEHRAVLAGGRHCVVAVGRLPYDAEVRLLPEQRGEGGSHAGVVIGDDDGDLAADRCPHRSTLAHPATVVVMRAHRSY